MYQSNEVLTIRQLIKYVHIRFVLLQHCCQNNSDSLKLKALFVSSQKWLTCSCVTARHTDTGKTIEWTNESTLTLYFYMGIWANVKHLLYSTESDFLLSRLGLRLETRKRTTGFFKTLKYQFCQLLLKLQFVEVVILKRLPKVRLIDPRETTPMFVSVSWFCHHRSWGHTTKHSHLHHI